MHPYMHMQVRVIACEPLGKDLQSALSANQRVLDPLTADVALDTIADAIRTKPFGLVPWSIASSLLEPRVIAVSDEQIRHAMRLALEELKQVLQVLPRSFSFFCSSL